MGKRLDPADLLDGGILDAARALRNRHVTIPALVAHCLERIDAIADRHAYIEVCRDRALKLADAYQSILDRGRDLGPLHGMPVAVKDNIDVAGTRTTAGSAILRDNVVTTDSAVARALSRSGAIIVGKNNLHEFAWGGTTANPHYGAALNAWDTERIPAGSSGGSAVAVALRSVFASIGTDSGGSVRCPAAANGVSGIRPTVGRISNAGVFPLSWSVDTVGPLAKSSQDCAILLAALAGYDASDPRSALLPVPDYVAGIDRPLTGLRVGWLDDYSIRHVQAVVRTSFEKALAVFGELGAHITPLTVPDVEAVVDAISILQAAEATTVHASWLRDRADEYGADVRTQLAAGFSVTAVDYLQAQRYRTHIRSQFAKAFESVDVILTPTMPYAALRHGQRTIVIDGRQGDALSANMQFTALASVPGLPALSTPMGFDDDGLPLGLQVLAPEYGEVVALRAGHQYQSQTRYHLRSPGQRRS